MKNFNFILIVITIILLVMIGVICVIGTVYVSAQPPEFSQSYAYNLYLTRMNTATLPFVIGLIIVLGLCIPKRLFSGKNLLIANSLLVLTTILSIIFIGAKYSLGLLMLIASIIQVAVIILTISGSKRISYEFTGFYLQVGSAILHLGFIVFIYDFVVLSEHQLHLPIFWFSTALIGLGMVLTFYSREISSFIKPKNQS